MKQDAYGPWPTTEAEMLDVLRSCLAGQADGTPHDYNTSAEAMTTAAVAAFNYIGSVLGCTGFQASVAGMLFLKVVRGMKGPFAILDGEQLLYPQYDLKADVARWLDEEWPPQLADLARQRLAEAGPIHPDVRQRFERIAALGSEDGAR